ncbi:calcium-activated chloride channel regulator 1-like isoform X2 [Saccostrea cucullata]|uniref:calcium-activated chloride channel regulator 1-like isoform X2 n=1 Tax=Saccostrea cuccullata TaxID=36930 RepID=UPI002ED01CBC
MMVLFYYLKFVCIVGYVNAVCQTNRIEIDGNGYTGITVAVSSKLEPSEIQLQRLKDLFTAASARLYKATKHHVFFKDITIVIPKSWPSNITDSYITGPQLDSAHVIVDKANPLANNKPYVSGMTGCGKPGRHIHLEPYTVQTLNAVGDADRLFVHHWGHFRWGLFDEHGDTESPVQESNRNTWFYSSGGTFKPNICVKNTKGKIELNYCGSNMKCSVDENGLPEKNCKFCGDETGNTVNGSIMGTVEISSVEEFCDEENSNVPHNKEAETPQNKICQGKSAWEIMRLHSDFKDTTPGSSSQNTTPTFRIVKQRAGQNFVLVLDKSGSMAGAKIKELKEISSIFITNWVSNGSSVGVVTFDTSAQIVSSLKLVTSDEVRKRLVTLINNIGAAGGTSIGEGLLKGIEVLKTHSDDIRGSEIILVSDGQNNAGTLGIDDVINQILAEKVIVTTVAISQAADKDMENLARQSGGSSHFYSGKDNSTALIDSFAKIAECASDDDNKMQQIESKSVSVTKGQNYTTVVYVDSTLGLDTVLLLQGPGVSDISAFIIGPGNQTWKTDSCTDSCRIKISGLAEVGTYNVQISSIADKDTTLTLTVHSYPKDPSEDVFTATAWISTDSFDFSPSTPLVIYALVMKGSSPVLDAYVSMKIEDSKGYVLTIVLTDNGLGEDVIKGDGLYTGVMLPSQIKEGGRHSLKLFVTGKSGETKILVPKVKRRKRETKTEDTTNLETRTVDGFQRVASSGSFTVYNYSQVNITNDIISPARITTLQVVNRKGNSFNVSWNAVGDDVTYGKALLYNILLSKNLSTLRDSPETIEPLTGNAPTPSNPESLEIFSFELPEVSTNYYLAVRAVDEAGNKGDVSNILSLSVITDSTWKREKIQSPSSSNEALIIGICVAALALIVLLVFGCVIYNRRKVLGKGAVV